MTDHNGWIDGQGEGGEEMSVCVCMFVYRRGGGRWSVFMTGKGQRLSDSFTETDSN